MDDKVLFWLRKTWWAALLILGSIYLWDNYSTISTKPTSFDVVVMLSTLVLAFMPIVSEISAFGMSIKKELVDTKKEIKNQVAGIRTDIFSLAISNANIANQSVVVNNNEAVPMKEEVQLTIKQSTASMENTSELKSEIDLINEFPITEKQIFLYQARYALEQKIGQIAQITGIKPMQSLVKTATIIRHNGFLSSHADMLINKVSSICNRGIHGEVVDDEYLEYIKIVLRELEEEFKLIENKAKKDSARFVHCSRCGYTGSSAYDNHCPNCGFTSDDY